MDCYLSKSLGTDIQSVLEVNEIRYQFGREIVDCIFKTGDRVEQRILKLYHKDAEDTSGIGIQNIARKNHLASIELAPCSINIPKVYGSYFSDDIACVVMEKLKKIERDPKTRVESASILSRLHNIPLDSLSHEFQSLIIDSKPDKDRGRIGLINLCQILDKNHPQWKIEYPGLSEKVKDLVQEIVPLSSMRTLTHGDYFLENLIPTLNGLCIINWDILALGDPMFDLGMLIGSDERISKKGINSIIREYRRTRSIDEEVLSWHINCWRYTLPLFRLMLKYKA